MTGWRRLLPLLLLCSNPGAAGDYWDRPIPTQHPPPPATCAACHPDQYADWSGSRHAHAFSPGLLGQLVDYAEADAVACLACHAPLADQQTPLLQTDLEALAAAPQGQRPDLLARHGVFCGACHLRGGVLNAPALIPSSPETRVHREVRIEPLMGDSRFCAPCHQFDQDVAVNGKPLQDTYREWLASPYPARGRTCQGCHMPGKAHRFRGIHDAETVRRGLTITTRSDESAATLEVRSSGIGHHFPTYIVPRVHLIGTLLDGDGHPVPGTERIQTLQRLVGNEDGDWIEQSDTRLTPDGTARLQVPWGMDGRCGESIRFRIRVEPEWYYYAKVYPAVMEELEEGPTRDLIRRAASLARSHDYLLFETTLVPQRGHDCSAP